MARKFDLSKIPAKETAKKLIKTNFDGEQDDLIRALNDGEKVTLGTLLMNTKDVYRTRNLYVFLLSCGLDIEQNVADYLYTNCNAEAIRVGDEIYTLSQLFEEDKAEEIKEAEKNSEKGTSKPKQA